MLKWNAFAIVLQIYYVHQKSGNLGFEAAFGNRRSNMNSSCFDVYDNSTAKTIIFGVSILASVRY